MVDGVTGRIVPGFLDTFDYQFVLSFELDGRQQPVPRVFAPWMKEHLDIVEDVQPRGLARRTGAPTDPFPFE